jgi:hypothetical protein
VAGRELDAASGPKLVVVWERAGSSNDHTVGRAGGAEEPVRE